MMTPRFIAAGALSEGSAYAAHVLEETLPYPQAKLGAYYGRVPIDNPMGSYPRVPANAARGPADALGIQAGTVLTEQQLTAILCGKRADGQDLKMKKQPRKVKTTTGQVRHKVSAIDFCLSAPKSYSLAWFAAKTQAERASIFQCHADANAKTMAYAASVLGGRATRKGHQAHEEAELIWIPIDHFTARATLDITRADPVTGVMGTEIYTFQPNIPGDPQIHTHNIMPNVAVTKDGRIVSIDTNQIHNRVHEFGAVYQAFLAQNLRNIGIDAGVDQRTQMSKVHCIPEWVCDKFDKRTKDATKYAQAAAKERGLEWDTMDPATKVKFIKGGAKASRRTKKDDLANFDAWQKQADDMGWHHETAVSCESIPKHENYLNRAANMGRRGLAEAFNKKAVMFGPEARTAAARGLIEYGIDTIDDISAVTRKFVHEGVHQNGEKTRLRYVETAQGVKITTDLHIEQELEAIETAREAHEDKARALTAREIDAAIAASGFDFNNEHGRAQIDVMHKLGTGGEFSLVIGCGGAGKTTLFAPLVAAYKAQEGAVWGTAAWSKRANSLKEAGVDRAIPLQPLITGLQDGTIKIEASTVLFLDEISVVGTKQLLDLLRLQKQYGFKIVSAGDPEQCQSIEAGPVIDLLRKALGEEAIPQILTSIRQKTEREREIAGLIREGKEASTAQALSMKQHDATAELVEGGKEDLIARVADLYMERQAVTDVSLSTGTNADAHAISEAIRARRQAIGEIAAEERVFKATDGKGRDYDLNLARGDRVRLFQTTRGTNGAILGNNSSVVEVRAVQDEGLLLKTTEGKERLAPWKNLMRDGKWYLAYGDCLTIDSSQGLTSKEHIVALTNGSGRINGFKAYVALSRHQNTAWLMASKGIEARATGGKRPLGINEPITDEQIWGNIAKNLSKKPVQELATDVFERLHDLNTKATHVFQGSMRRNERGDKTEGRMRVQAVRLAKDFFQAVPAGVKAGLEWRG